MKDSDKIDRLVHRMRRRGFLSSDDADAAQLATTADSKLFKAMCNNPQHVLTNLFPPRKNTGHNTRARVHNFELPKKNKKKYIPHMLYTNIYIYIYIYIY